MKVTAVNWAYDDDLVDEEALLSRYATLTAWSDALREAGASRVTVVQRFHRDGMIVRNRIEYRFCRDGGGPRPPAWAASPPVARAVAAAKPDVVHVNGLVFPVQTWRLRQRIPAASALIVQDHAGGPPRASGAWPARIRHAIRRRAMRAPDGYFFTSAEQAEPWRTCGLIGGGQRVHAVNESSTHMCGQSIAEARRITGMSGDPAILWVGRLNANKDPLCVVDAFAQVRGVLPGATLTMVHGADDLLAAVRQRVAERNLAGSVRLAGAMPHCAMAAFYSGADLFVLGSHHEGSGYALLEACACGAAPAVTDIPAFRALAPDGAAGRLWPVGDSRACAEALVGLAREPCVDRRRRVRAHFQRSLSWSAVARRALAGYELVVGDREARLRGAMGR